MPKVLAILFILSAVIFTGCTPKVTTSEQTYLREKEGFSASGSYQGNNTWTYKVTGEIPSPCHGMLVIPTKDSAGSTLTLRVLITQPEEDVSCIQVLQEVTKEGTFTAAQDIKIDLVIERT